MSTTVAQTLRPQFTSASLGKLLAPTLQAGVLDVFDIGNKPTSGTQVLLKIVERFEEQKRLPLAFTGTFEDARVLAKFDIIVELDGLSAAIGAVRSHPLTDTWSKFLTSEGDTQGKHVSRTSSGLSTPTGPPPLSSRRSPTQRRLTCTPNPTASREAPTVWKP